MDATVFEPITTDRPQAGEGRRAVVIGGGFGGLALAVRLQSAGMATTLVEGRDKLGGRAYVYEQDGFTFDAGPTVITDPSALEELFALSGRRMGDYVTLLPVEPFYRLLWENGRQFDYVNDQAALDPRDHRLQPRRRGGLQTLPGLFAGGVRGGVSAPRPRAVPGLQVHAGGGAQARPDAGLAQRL